MLDTLLQKNSKQLAAEISTLNSEDQSIAKFLLTSISKKKHQALIKFLKEKNQLHLIKSNYEIYKEMDSQALLNLLKTEQGVLSLSALIPMVYIMGCLTEGKPIDLIFPYSEELGYDFEENIKDWNEWLYDEIGGLTDEKLQIPVSQWAESHRYLPQSMTSIPGFYSFDVVPYLREIADCFSVNSPVRQVAVMKGVQLGCSVGIIENSIGYEIEHVKTSPCMLVTADQELAQTVVETRIGTMLDHSDLKHLIQSADETNKRKTGRTNKRLEWKGGGFLLPYGANNPAKLRSMSISRLYLDEIDAYKQELGEEGSPIDLAVNRTAAFEETRKICYISTPLVSQTSKIEPLYEQGDQRKYYVPCTHCKTFQQLEWRSTTKDGDVYGVTFEWDSHGNLIEDSVAYVCPHCGGVMKNHDKAWMLPRGEWRATAQPKQKNFRSYHINSLYSPVGMQSWVEIVKKWFIAWDVVNDRVKDFGALKTFYNLCLGRTYEERGSNLKLEQVVLHRRSIYNSGEIPNEAAKKETGSPILVLTAAVDVHKRHLDIQVIGWCPGSRFYSIEWIVVEGDTTDKDSANSPWNVVRDLIENKFWIADDGKKYMIQTTLIDAGYSPAPDLVYEFCSEYSGGVFPIMGREMLKNAKYQRFAPYVSKQGTTGWNIVVTGYKDKLAAGLRHEWESGASLQPPNHPNFPQDYPEEFFKQMTVETKKERVNKITGQRLGFVWHRPSGAENHSWDLTVYCWAALDMLILEACNVHFGIDGFEYARFWELAEQQGLYFTDGL